LVYKTLDRNKFSILTPALLTIQDCRPWHASQNYRLNICYDFRKPT
jgi:hypothetical protein